MNEYPQMGVNKPIELAPKEDTCFYFPHCLVFTKSSSTIFMIVGPCIMNQCQQSSNKMRLYTVYYISVNWCTCFGWWFHPSSGAHIVPTAPRQRKVAETGWPVPDAVITVICAPDDGWSYHPKHVEHPRCLNFISRRFGTLCLFHLHTQEGE
jgi:hypothetical protein